MHVSITVSCNAQGEKKRVSDLMNLELQMVGSRHLVLGFELGLLHEQPMFITDDLSLMPQDFFLNKGLKCEPTEGRNMQFYL